MKPSLWHQLDAFAKAVFPFGLTVVLVVGIHLPLRAPEVAPVVPMLALPAVYYWSIYRPDLMPLWTVFLIGVLHDLIAGTPLGVGSAVLLMVGLAVAAQRRLFAHAGFLLQWIVFLVIAAAAFAMLWLLSSLLLLQWLPGSPLLLQYGTTTAAYPLLAWVFGRAQQFLLR